LNTEPQPEVPDELVAANPVQDPTFFTDRGLGKYVVPDMLRAIGLKVVTYAECYPGMDQVREGGDQKWLLEVGRRGWVVLTKDKCIRSNQLEIRALLDSGAPCFALTSGSIKGERMGEIFTKAMPETKAFLVMHTPPYVAIVNGSAKVQMLFSAAELANRLIPPNKGGSV
jgi:PIN like domain